MFESGANRGVVSTYTTADRFRVAVEGGVVKYRKNGTLVYTSTVTPTYPLLVDAGLYHNGGTQSNVVISGNLSGTTAENVAWTNVVGVTVSGNSLTKTAATAWGNAGAASTRSLVSGDGYVEFSVSSLYTGMVALSHTDTNQAYTTMEFALLPNSDGNLYVFESGVNRGVVSTYASSDRLRVAVESGVVKYRKNGVLVYTSTVAPAYPLLVDTCFNTVNAPVYNVVIASNVQNVTWTSVASTLQVTGNSLQKTSGTSSWYDAGAVSSQTLAAGDGYLEFTPGDINTWRMIGLGNGNAGIHYSDIEYALFLGPSGGLQIYEAGILRGSFGTYASSDRLRVAVESGIVKYRKNGALVYTSTVAPTYPLLVDTCFNTVNAPVYNVVITSTTPSSSGNINWLVADQLGTPRMIIDKTGSLAGVKRHDYLPFGEELAAGTGGRTTAQGYSGDNVRQKFTSKERDNETGLDYFLARYYSSTQGRFTSGDPASLAMRHLVNPQDLNRYAYVANNPLKFIDPNGEEKIQIVVDTYIPTPVTPAVNHQRFEGDNRPVPEVGEPQGSGSFRTQQIITVETDPSKDVKGTPQNWISSNTGITSRVDCNGDRCGTPAQSNGTTLTAGVTRNKDGSVEVNAHGNESNPKLSSPGITYNYNVNVKDDGKGGITVTVAGSHDQYPAHVVTASRVEQPNSKAITVYSFNPVKAGTNPYYLLPPAPDKRIEPKPVKLP